MKNVSHYGSNVALQETHLFAVVSVFVRLGCVQVLDKLIILPS